MLVSRVGQWRASWQSLLAPRDLKTSPVTVPKARHTNNTLWLLSKQPKVSTGNEIPQRFCSGQKPPTQIEREEKEEDTETGSASVLR